MSFHFILAATRVNVSKLHIFVRNHGAPELLSLLPASRGYLRCVLLITWSHHERGKSKKHWVLHRDYAPGFEYGSQGNWIATAAYDYDPTLLFTNIFGEMISNHSDERKKSESKWHKQTEDLPACTFKEAEYSTLHRHPWIAGVITIQPRLHNPPSTVDRMMDFSVAPICCESGRRSWRFVPSVLIQQLESTAIWSVKKLIFMPSSSLFSSATSSPPLIGILRAEHRYYLPASI